LLRRREFIALLGCAVGSASLPDAARAQPSGRLPTIGILLSYSEDDPEEKSRITAFEQGLRDLGWINGRNVLVVYRYGAGDDERMGKYAHELVSQNPSVLVANSVAALVALRRATDKIPIVVAGGGDLVASGYVASLAHPGSNVTGFTSFEPRVGGKWLELLREAAPNVSRVLVLESPNPQRTSYFPSIETAARAINVAAIKSDLHGETDVDSTLDNFARHSTGGLIVMPSPFTSVHRRTIIAAAARDRLPDIYPYRYFAEEGGLLAYGSDGQDIFRRSASYVDRILRGASPASLPIQEPVKFEFIVNLRTAKALGLEIPATLLTTADEVIQ
jgi:putative tryptophan/tyrosine transport system substrate-binding protein